MQVNTKDITDRLAESIRARGMRRRRVAVAAALAVAALWSTAITVRGQEPTAKSTTPVAGKVWSPPRTPDGRPDLQGVWANNNITPLERPAQWEGKQQLTGRELADLKNRAADVVAEGNDGVFGDTLVLLALAKEKNAQSREECNDQPVRRASDPLPDAKDCVTAGSYNHFWLAARDFDNPRTSLVVDPPDGKIPPLTPEAKQKLATTAEYRRLHPADGPEDRSLGERCVVFGIPKLGGGYNSYYQIFQTTGYVAILSEMAHDARIIPLDGRPHLGRNVRQWNGDARGHWDGDTLVVETTNFSIKSDFRGSRDNLHLIERFARVGPSTLNYEVTITDSTTWTRPWKTLIPLKVSQDQVYEYACHEGNYGMEGILRAARSKDGAAK